MDGAEALLTLAGRLGVCGDMFCALYIKFEVNRINNVGGSGILLYRNMGRECKHDPRRKSNCKMILPSRNS